MGQGLGGFNGGGCFCLCVQGFDRVLGLGLAAFGPAMLGIYRVHIRFFGCARWRFRPYGESLWQTPQRNQRSRPLRSAPRCGSASLRSGIHPGASPTVCFAAPPLDVFGFAKRSLRSHPRINPSTQPSDGAGTSRALLELTLIVLSGEEQVGGGLAWWGLSEHRPPSLCRRRRESIGRLSKRECDSVSHVGVLSQTTRSVPSPPGRGLGWVKTGYILYV